MDNNKFLQEKISKMVESIGNQKEAIVKSKMIEKGMAIPSIDAMKQYRFNPLMCEHHEGYGDLYYYNDGTKNGQFIVGFKFFNFIDTWENPTLTTSIEFGIITEEPEWNKRKDP